jgi:D-alanyl-D-alanine dipeptidase
MNRAYLMAICLHIFFLQIVHACPADTIRNRYGLWVIRSGKEFVKTIHNNPEKRMCDISAMIPGILIELKYAGIDNFSHTKLYPTIRTSFLRLKAAQALKKVELELNDDSLGLNIWDAYRPYSITERMWEMVKDERYAANPRFGSGHNRGIAVDLTIVRLKDHTELDMGTGFDHFGDSAHHDFTRLETNVIENRKRLRTTMEKHGFRALESEWWHYYFSDSNDYELLDLSFKQLSAFAASYVRH